MGLQGALRPKSLDEKYEAIPDHRKNLYYVFRRDFGMSRAEVDALPWWEIRLLVEKHNEANAGSQEDDPDDITPINPQDHVTDDLAAFGLTVNEI